MGAEVLWLFVPATVGVAALGGIFWHERATDRAMRASRETFDLIFPAGLSEASATAALVALCGTSARHELAFEVLATADRITHRLHVPRAVSQSVRAQLAAGMPGLRVRTTERTDARGAVQLTLRVPGGATLRSGDGVPATRAVLASLLPLGRAEQLRLIWTLRSGGPATAPTNQPAKGDSGRNRMPGFRVTGALLVRAAYEGRARALAARVLAVLRSRRTPGPQIEVSRASRPDVVPALRARDGWLPATEMIGLLAWPLGDAASEGVSVTTSRRIAPPKGAAKIRTVPVHERRA